MVRETPISTDCRQDALFDGITIFYEVENMVRKMNDKDRSYLLIDEMPRVHNCLNSAVDDAETNDYNDYGILSPHFYYIIQNGTINTCIDRSSFTATRIRIQSILSRLGVFYPRHEYRCDGSVA